ncbi:helix-turn-helix domain-containing protein [bacterium]|nr:helix-turn-helix domain-containing protein [bacterium]
MIKPIKVSPKWLTCAEAAFVLGKGQSTIWRWAVAGKLGAECVTSNGRQTYRIPREEVERAKKRIAEGLPAIS